MVYSLSEGETLVRAARHTVDLYLNSAKFNKTIVERRASHLDEHHGIFVSIRHYPLGAMRGSAALIKGVKPVRSLIVDAAIKAAFEDERHVSISMHELDHIVFEVGVITHRTKLSGPVSRMKIKPGTEGVMLEYGYKTGFLLPQEIKKGDKTEKLLERLCKIAGLGAHDYKRSDLSFHKFSAQKFIETEPQGAVEEVL